MNRMTQEILLSLARRCKEDANSAFAAGEKEENPLQKAMLRGKCKQASQTYNFLRQKYPILNLPPIHD